MYVSNNINYTNGNIVIIMKNDDDIKEEEIDDGNKEEVLKQPFLMVNNSTCDIAAVDRQFFCRGRRLCSGTRIVGSSGSVAGSDSSSLQKTVNFHV